MPYKDKNKQKLVASKHYNDNKVIYKKRAHICTKASRKRNKEYVQEYLRTHPCMDCDEKNIIVLDFDHIRGNKINNISTAVNIPWSLEKLKKEIEKCEVRCANCHRIATHKRNSAACEKSVISVGS